MNLATEKQIAKALAFQLGFPYINLAENPPDPTAVVLIPKDVALKRVCVAVRLEKNLLTVAMSDPLLFSLVQDLEFQTGYRIKQVVVDARRHHRRDSDRLSRQGADAHDAGEPQRARGARARSRRAAARLASRCRRGDGAGAPGRRGSVRAGRRPQGAQRSGADHRPRRSRREERDQEQGERHPRRADGKRRAHPPPPRRPAQGSDGPAQVGPRGADRAPEDHGRHGHRREAAAAGRPSALDRRGRHRGRLPRLDAAHAVRREGRHARARSPQGRARPRGDRHVGDRARGSARVPPPPARHDSRRRPDRQRQDDDAQLGAEGGAVGEDQHHHDRGSDRVPDPRRQPDADQREDQADVRERAAVDPAAGSRRHPARRDPRRRDGEDRDAGGADRPPRAVDAAHRQRAVGRHAADGHRRRAVRHRVGAGRRRRAAARAAAVRALPPPVHAAGRRPALAEHRRGRRGGDSVLQVGRLRSVQPHRLPRPHRHLRSDARHRQAAAADRRQVDRRSAARGGGRRRHDHARRRRPREGEERRSRRPRSCCAW